jgi:hypothetical protein
MQCIEIHEKINAGYDNDSYDLDNFPFGSNESDRY